MIMQTAECIKQLRLTWEEVKTLELVFTGET